MQITILAVPDCPNAPVVTERIRAALDGQVASIELIEIADEGDAARWGMAGSPTILVDGFDPFAAPSTAGSLSCRLYRTADGAIAGSPSVDELRRVLIALPAPPRPAGMSWLGPAGRAGQGRLAPAERGLRQVQQAVLRSLGCTGRLPEPAVLDQLVVPFSRTVADVLRELAAGDFLALDDHGGIRAAYPFSIAPKRHRVQVKDGPAVWAMCAVDSLGVAPMLGRDVTITSPDPITGETITVLASPSTTIWEPSTAVVFAGGRTGHGPAETACCDSINCFASPNSATRWAALHPDVVGVQLDQVAAVDLGRRIFGDLLKPDA